LFVLFESCSKILGKFINSPLTIYEYLCNNTDKGDLRTASLQRHSFRMGNQQVLVIEDEPEFRQNLVEMLQTAGWHVIEAAGGQAGLDRIQSGDRPDIVLCDIVMPDVDGFAVLKTFRSQVETAGIPFVFLTGKADVTDQRLGMCQGADDYLIKPVRRSDLVEVLSMQLKKAHCRQEGARQMATSQQAIQAQLQMSQLRESESQVWISGITHDLRAPLTTIKVALELIEQAPEKRSQYLSIARQACEQGDALIEEMLTFYRDDPTDPATVTRLDLSSLMLNLHQTFAARARLHDLNLEWDSPTTLLTSPWPRVPLSLQRILTELLNNAFKYTPRSGTIHFQLRPLQTPSLLEGPGLQGLEVMIRNQAEIPAQAMSHLFDKFYQVRDDLRGSGLGLTIVRQLVNQLQGTLQVASQSGWTTFTLQFPHPALSTATRSIKF
jgi:two-component system, sensor histidine kinase and response regulator